MKEWEYQCDNYSLKYTLKEDKVYITSCYGNVPHMTIPSVIEGKPVVGIEKKAFLSKKNLKEITLPAKMEEIGDWAFAFCRRLERVTFPTECPSIGKSIFQECDSLQHISGSKYTSEIEKEFGKGCEEYEGEIRPLVKSWSEGVAALLAAAVSPIMDTYYLLTPESVGNDEWLEKWDRKLDSFLSEDDTEGYSKQILCGEEDYGSTDLNAFIREKRKKKIKISFLRLLNKDGITQERYKRLSAYVLGLSYGKGGSESWLVLRDELFDKPEYVQLFLDLGCVTIDNVDEMIQDIPVEKAELKAILLRYKEEHFGNQDFFGGLLL